MVAERLGREVQRAVNVAAVAAAAALVKTASITASDVDTGNGNDGSDGGDDNDGGGDGDALTEDTSDQLYAALLETVPCLVKSIHVGGAWLFTTRFCVTFKIAPSARLF
jgi:hypothetical protein